ncbi:hypothetical protein WK36_07945 [Burkholderia cepacia]|nr:hypothetical protein WK36_07945 [Burkholderia cepacia]
MRWCHSPVAVDTAFADRADADAGRRFGHVPYADHVPLLVVRDLCVWWDAAHGSDAASLAHVFLFDLNLPRVAAALVAGGCLGIAGALFQSLTRNPLASPDLLGVTGGAQLGLLAAMLVPALAGVATVPLLFVCGLAAAACAIVAAGAWHLARDAVAARARGQRLHAAVRRAAVRRRRRAGQFDGRAVSGRAGRRARLLGAPGADRRALRARSVYARRAAVPHGRARTPARTMRERHLQRRRMLCARSA